MGKFKGTLKAILLLQALVTAAWAQQYHGEYGVFEGFAGGQATVRTATQEAHFLIDQYTRFGNGSPSPGDWVHVEVDPYGRAVDFLIEEHPARRAATVDHLEGPMVVVRTNYGVEMWNDVVTTWHLGVAPGGLLPGDSIDAAVFRNRNLAYVRLDSRSAAPPPPPDMNMPPNGGDNVQAMVAPPPLPAYDVPPCPEPDYIWTPGYWHWAPAGYYWVPGVWVAPPAPGLLWTPGFWAFVGGAYLFHAGYWGAHVGFYGGVVYGAGYYGEGFVGARWEGGHVVYNTAAVQVNTTVVHNTYVNNTVVINNQTTTINNITNNINKTQNVSFSGPGGARATPTPAEQKWANEAHVKPTPMQMQHVQAAQSNPQLQQSFNHGRPAAAMLSAPRIQSMAALPPGASPAGGAPRATTPSQNIERPGGVGTPRPPAQPQNLQQQRMPTRPEATRPAQPQTAAESQNRKTAEPHPQAKPHPAPPVKEEKRAEGKEREERR